MMRFKWSAVLTFLLILTLMMGGSALAFNDIKDTVGKEEIMALKDKGILSGITDTTFAPQGKLTYAQGITLIVKGLDLNTNAIDFFKMPEASDVFTKVANKAWYAQSLLYAKLNGLKLAKDLDPNKLMTREEFTNFLIEGINTKGQFPMIMMYAVINDEKDVNKDYMNSIQQALITKITTVDKEQNFFPKHEITRAEAAIMLFKAIDFVDAHKDNVLPDKTPPAYAFPNAEVSFVSTPVTNAVYKVELTWTLGHPGSIKIDRIDFQDHQAVIYYSLHEPEKGNSYTEVLADVKTSTFVDAAYQVRIERSEISFDSSVSSGFDPTQSTGIINPETGTSQSPEASAGQ